MLHESALKIEVHRRGQVEVLEVHGERALVGSGAHCDVRLAPDEGAIEQLLLEVRDEEVFLIARSFDPPCRLNGAPLLEGRLSRDALVEFGPIALRVELTEAKTQGAPVTPAHTSRTHPGVQAMALVGLVLGFYVLLNDEPEGESALHWTATPPALFSDEPEACPQRDQEAARSLADQLYLEAENKRERSPFYPRDGLLAVPLYERAAACYELTGLTQETREARTAAAALKQRMLDELHVRHVRIERLIARMKFDAIRHEARLLSEFVQDPSHPYAHWLSALVRETELQRTQRRN